MVESILIVEDEFLEADNLKIILETAGYAVCGIVRNVLQAKEMILRERPSVVLIDIRLNGPETGIDLAHWLEKFEIPFIYLSANSNESTLQAAKLTQPYGFLVKPFRENDILVTIGIAMFRHKLLLEVRQKQQEWLSGLLMNIFDKTYTIDQRLHLLAKTFQSFIQYDYILIETNMESGNAQSVFGFQRVSYEEYDKLDTGAFFQNFNISLNDLKDIRQMYIKDSAVTYHNDLEFVRSCENNKINENFRNIFGVESGLMVPIIPEQGVKGAISFLSKQKKGFTDDHLKLITQILPILGTVIGNILKVDQGYGMKPPRKEPSLDLGTPGFPGIVGKSPNFLFALDQIKLVAPSDTSVLILGETGAGKEGLVDALHQLSPRRDKPLIKINCAAIPQGLVESELFGHERGAFTDARERRIGKFEQAQGGTIFLDEIGEIPLSVQTKLLRVLQEREIERVGGRSMIKIDVRIVAATNRDLYKEVAVGNFRLDLYYRMFVFPIQLPPLRERKEDIPLLTDHFLLRCARANGAMPKKLSPEALQQLMDYTWPGNIRELQHLIERNILLTNEPVISSFVMPEIRFVRNNEPLVPKAQLRTIDEVEKEHILMILQRCNGKIAGPGGAAEVLNIPASSLRLRMKRLGIEWEHVTK